MAKKTIKAAKAATANKKKSAKAPVKKTVKKAAKKISAKDEAKKAKENEKFLNDILIKEINPALEPLKKVMDKYKKHNLGYKLFLLAPNHDCMASSGYHISLQGQFKVAEKALEDALTRG